MCKIQDKRVLFNHFIDEIVKYERKDTQNKEEVDEVLQEYNMAKLMTLLYFACLSSVPNNEDEEFNYEKDTLFGVFDNFITDIYGPVEVDLSTYGRFLPNYIFDKDQYIKKTDSTESHGNTSTDTDDSLDSYKKKITGFFTNVQEVICNLLQMTIEELVSLFQTLVLWTYAIRTNSKRLAVRNSANLTKERKAYNNRIENLYVHSHSYC